MLSCLRPAQPTSAANNYVSSPTSQGHSVDNTPRSSTPLSPTVNLTSEYNLAVQTNSCGEICRTFFRECSFDHSGDLEQVDLFEESQLLEQVLQPSREYIHETLSNIRHNALTQLVATYFQHSERSSSQCLILYQSVHRARHLYASLHNLLDDLPFEFNSDTYSISHSQCNWTFDIFLQFDSHDNPVIYPTSHNFDNIRQCFSQLRQQLDHHLKKLSSRGFIRNAASSFSLCSVAADVGVALSAVTLFASPICPSILPSNMTKKKMAHLAQPNAAAKGTFVLHYLNTIDCLVALLHSTVENDKLHIQFALERGRDRHPIEEVLIQFRRNRPKFLEQLVGLEEHLFLCFAAINRTRSQLLEEMHLHHIRHSQTNS